MNLSTRSNIFLAMAVCAAACSGPSARPVATAPPSLDDVRNTTVVGLFDDPVTLRDGRWEGEPYVAGGASRPSAGVIGDLSVAGDLDGDEILDLVAVWQHASLFGQVLRQVVAQAACDTFALATRTTQPAAVMARDDMEGQVDTLRSEEGLVWT